MRASVSFVALAATFALVSAQAPPACVELCIRVKQQEAGTLAPNCAQNDINCYCSTETFTTAYTNCLNDNCANAEEVATGSQLGAQFCGTGTIPGVVTVSGVGSSASASASSAAESASSAASAGASSISESASSAASSISSGASAAASSASAGASSAAASASSAVSSLAGAASSRAASILPSASASASGSGTGAATGLKVQGAAALLAAVGGAALVLA